MTKISFSASTHLIVFILSVIINYAAIYVNIFFAVSKNCYVSKKVKREGTRPSPKNYIYLFIASTAFSAAILPELNPHERAIPETFVYPLPSIMLPMDSTPAA